MIIKAIPKCLQTPEAVAYPPPNYGSDRSLLWVEVGYMIIKATPKCLQTPEAVGYPPSNYCLDRSSVARRRQSFAVLKQLASGVYLG